MNNDAAWAEIYDLYGYMASAARELTVDPAIYGPFRMVDSMSRIVTLLRNMGYSDPFSDKLQTYIEENKYSVMSSQEEFERFLEGLVLKIAEYSIEEGKFFESGYRNKG